MLAVRRSTDIAAARRAYIGGTDIAPILGISEKKTRFAVWASKVRTDLRPDTANEEEAAAGTFFEPFILQRFANRFHVAVVPCTHTTYLRRSAVFLGANPDGLVFPVSPPEAKLSPPLGIVDAKTRSPFMRGLWGPEGSDDVPADELCQVQWYMEILDLPVAYLAVFFDRQLVLFVVHRDRELGQLAVEEATAFWNEYVLSGREPPFEGPAAHDYLRRRFPSAIGPMKDAELEDDILVARRDLIKRHMAVLKTRLDVVEGALKTRIASASGLLGTGYVAQWGNVKPKTTTDFRAVVTELRSFPVVADESVALAIRQQIDAAIARHTRVGEPSRRLHVRFRGPRALPEVEIEPITRALLTAAPTEEEDSHE